MEDSLEWSEDEYPLTDFVRKFVLPQVARVEQGYHDGNEETALGYGQVVTLHVVKEADTVVAKDQQDRRVYIPRTCCQKVEVILPGARNNYFKTVAELSHFFPRAIRLLQEPRDRSVNVHVGDKLFLKKNIKKQTFLECENEKGVRVRLPINMEGHFVPLQDGQEYFVYEVLNLFKLPVLVQFVDSKGGKQTKTSSVFKSSLGALSLEEVMKEETVICSTKDETTDKRYVITIPRNLNIAVAAAQGALTDDGNYVRLCKSLNDGIELSKVEALESENVYASRQEIREYMQLQFSSIQSVYEEPVPPRPLPRIAKTSTFPSHGNNISEVNEDDDIYESIPTTSQDIKVQQPIISIPQQNVYQDILRENGNKKLEKKQRNSASNSEEEEGKINGSGSPPPVPTSPKPTQDTIDFSSLTVDGVAELLSKHRLGAFAETFKEEEIDGNMLIELDLDSLKDLGLNNFQAKKLMLLIQGWLPKVDK